MDYRKDMRTPKDRVDGELLSRLLRETDELLEGCGCDTAEYSHGSRRSERRNSERSRVRSCGCGCARNDTVGRTGRTCGNDNGCASRRTTEGCCERSGEHHGTEHRDHEEEWGCVNRRSMSVQTQGLPLVMSYAPDHEFCDLHEDEEALKTGTLFHGLMFPFYGVRCDGCPKTHEKNCGCGE